MNPLIFFQAFGIEKRRILGEYAKLCLGKDMGDSGYGDDVDCMISVYNVVFNATGIQLGDKISTARAARSFRYNPRWREIQIWKAEAGDIVISPTQGDNTGHVGICGEFDIINKYPQEVYSNNSRTGLWDKHWGIGSWWNYFVYKKGLEMKVYRLIY